MSDTVNEKSQKVTTGGWSRWEKSKSHWQRKYMSNKNSNCQTMNDIKKRKSPKVTANEMTKEEK